MKDRGMDILRWALPAALVMFAIVYSYQRRFETTYWDGAVGNWLATLLGIVTGVPVALYLERNRAKSERAERLRADQLDKRDGNSSASRALIGPCRELAGQTSSSHFMTVRKLAHACSHPLFTIRLTVA